jgi:hypothetical protein
MVMAIVRPTISEQYKIMANKLTRDESNKISNAFGPKKQIGVAISAGLHPILRILALLEYSSVSLWIERRIIETLRALTEAGFIAPDDLYGHLVELHETPEGASACLKELLRLRDAPLEDVFAEYRGRLVEKNRRQLLRETTPEPAVEPEDRDLKGLIRPAVKRRSKVAAEESNPDSDQPTQETEDIDDLPEV